LGKQKWKGSKQGETRGKTGPESLGLSIMPDQKKKRPSRGARGIISRNVGGESTGPEKGPKRMNHCIPIDRDKRRDEDARSGGNP